jgi:UDP-N-acetylmuramoyl-tripeptide--D-alanyl-D-alanine ligase
MKDIFKKTVVSILTFEAQILLKRTKPTIVAITGSVGKTSTKDAIYAVLKRHVHARKSEKSFNSDIGVALTVLGLRNAWNNPFLWVKNILDGALHALFARDYPKVLILEMGVDRPGDMKRLTHWIKPDVVVLTRLPSVPVHVEYFRSPEEVIEEKMQLVYALKTDGVFIYNHDDEKIAEHLEEVRQQSFGFSRYSPSHFTATKDVVLYDGATPTGMQFTITHVEEEANAHVYGSLGVQHAYTFAAACAVAHYFGIALKDALADLNEHQPPQARMRIIPGIEESTLLDDTYNSSPVAAEHAILTLHELRTKGRKIAVLGDMLELGQFSVREHERLGEFLAQKVDMLVTVGVRARKIAEGALEFGLSEKNIFQYEEAETAAGELKGMIKKGDVVLVKASQGIRAEKIVKALMREPEQADSLLARQDDFWMKK